MTDTRCEAFMQDPERFASHPGECADCSKLVADLDRLDRKLADDLFQGDGDLAPTIATSLPLAAWEGARFRSWPVAIVSAVVILGLAAGAFSLLGISPLGGVTTSIMGQLASSAGYVEAGRHFAGMVRSAPAGFHIAVGIAFVAVNAFFYYLLRRAPRGIDVSSR